MQADVTIYLVVLLSPFRVLISQLIISLVRESEIMPQYIAVLYSPNRLNFALLSLQYSFFITSFIVYLLFTVRSPITFVTEAVISVYTIHTLSIDTGT